MTPLAWWLLAAAMGLVALLCAQLASMATLILLYLDLDAIRRPGSPLQQLRPRWTAQRLMWRVLSVVSALNALALVAVALGLW